MRINKRKQENKKDIKIKIKRYKSCKIFINEVKWYERGKNEHRSTLFKKSCKCNRK